MSQPQHYYFVRFGGCQSPLYPVTATSEEEAVRKSLLDQHELFHPVDRVLAEVWPGAHRKVVQGTPDADAEGNPMGILTPGEGPTVAFWVSTELKSAHLGDLQSDEVKHV